MTYVYDNSSKVILIKNHLNSEKMHYSNDYSKMMLLNNRHGRRKMNKNPFLIIFGGCGCVFLIVAIGLLIGWSESKKLDEDFNKAKCLVEDSTLFVSLLDCTCDCPYRVRDTCDDDDGNRDNGIQNSNNSLEINSIGLLQTCSDLCIPSSNICCKDNFCNIRHDGYKAVWKVQMIEKLDDDNCPESFRGTIKSSKKCHSSTKRANGESSETLSFDAEKDANKERRKHKVGNEYTCYYRKDKCHGSDSDQEIRWKLRDTTKMYIAMLFFFSATGACLLVLWYVYLCVPCMEKTSQAYHNTKFIPEEPKDLEGYMPRDNPPEFGEAPPDFKRYDSVVQVVQAVEEMKPVKTSF